MALIKCGECHREISTTVKACPHCGFVTTAPATSTGLKVALGIFALFIIYQLVKSPATNQLENTPTSQADLQTIAVVNCIDSIKQTLNDPSAAEFGDPSQAKVIEMGLNAWKITLPLRAKNGFNALRLIEVECSIKFDGSNWVTSDVKQLDT